jgi:hypothetical protein
LDQPAVGWIHRQVMGSQKIYTQNGCGDIS